MKKPETLKIRHRYLKRIDPFIGKSILKILSGQRRVGKTFLIFQIIDQIKEQNPDANIICINCEDLDFSFIRNGKELNSYILSKWKDGVSNHIFIDEIQEIEEYEKTLSSLLLKPGNDIYLTFNNANLLNSELAGLLIGKYVEFSIYSLSYPEFLDFHNIPDSSDNFRLFAKYGGLPFLRNLKLTDEVAWEYLRSIYTTIIFRDVVLRNNINNNLIFDRYVKYVAENSGSPFFPKKISEFISSKRISDFIRKQQSVISSVQIQKYTSHLADAFLIRKVNRLDVSTGKELENGEKYYFDNTGIRNAIAGFKTLDKERIYQNIIFNHLLYLGFEVKAGVFSGNEIDFIANRLNEKIYILVTGHIEDTKSFEKEYGFLMKIKDNYPKWVITENEFSGNSIEGIKVIPIREFLMLEF
jgi:predicted AAA+ superfamily ATPase